jgi:hypothetical protein
MGNRRAADGLSAPTHALMDAGSRRARAYRRPSANVTFIHR